ncbi:hypothetical protein EYF80_018856 [Liparis tanakae]|uniref:Uncharacterized protein n=1 Tax=Liparis tanakae TaxID=230148 RepID=A0A4Z2HZ74_9TELE|nr:hypothetical protein EYF80_018856 [Liparis tanakae]
MSFRVYHITVGEGHRCGEEEPDGYERVDDPRNQFSKGQVVNPVQDICTDICIHMKNIHDTLLKHRQS